MTDLDATTLAGLVDHTLLKPEATADDVAALVADPVREPAEVRARLVALVLAGQHLDVVGDADAVPDAAGTGQVHRLRDRVQPGGLAGVDGDREARLAQGAERGEVS